MACARDDRDGLHVNLQQSDVRDKYGDLFKCTICLEQYTTPRVLPCLHSFCEICLENHIKVNLKVIPARLCSVFTCPTCREEVIFPAGGVSGFKRDFRVEQLHDYLTQAEGESSRPDVKDDNQNCQFCETESADSMLFCGSCNKRICSPCSARHVRKSIFSNHVIHPRKTDSGSAGRPEESCNFHPGELMSNICQDCNIPICSICAMTTHDDHITQDLELGIKDAIDALKFQFKCMAARLSQLRLKQEEVSQLDRSVHDNLVCQTTAIKMKVKEVMEQASRKGDDLTEEVSRQCQKQLDVIDCRQSDIELIMARMNSLSDLALDLIGRTNGVSMLKSYSDLTSRIDQALEDSLLLHSDITDLKVRFEPVDVVVDLGDVVRYTQDREADRESRSRGLFQARPAELGPVMPFCDEEPQKPSGLSLKAKLGRLGNAGGEFDSPRDVCFLGNDRFVIADTNNDRLQIFNLNGLLVKVIAQGQMKPWGVTATKDGNIAATDNYEKCIKVFSVDGTFVEKIGKLLCPCGVTCNHRGEFVVTDFFNTHVVILDRTGATVKRFEMRTRHKDRHTCGASRVVIGPENLIVISDISNCCVKIFNKNGRFMSRVTHPDHMISPQGIGTDHYGNILVADTIKQRILVLSKDGEYITSLETSGDRMRDVTGLAVSIYGDVVATLMKSNQIRIFALDY